MTLIELGDVTSSSPPRPAREFDAATLRWFLAAAVAVLSVLTLTGSARPESRLVRPLWSIPFLPDDRYAITADTVYVSSLTTAGRLAAHDVATGRVRWTLQMPEPTGWPDVAEPAGVVLLQADRVAEQFNGPDGGSYLAESYRRTVAVDTRTGNQLWSRPGNAYGRTDDTVLLVDWTDDGSVSQGFRMIRLRDGAVAWTGPALGTVRLATGGADPLRPEWLVAVKPDGDTRVYRWADGRVVATGRIGWRVGRPGDGDLSDLFIDGRNLYVRLTNGGGASLTAYRLDTLEQIWHVDGAARVSAGPCGPVVCAFEPDSIAAYDPDTGVARWRAVGVQSASPVGDGLLLTADGAQDAYSLLDVETGRRVAPLGLGFPVLDDRTGTFLLTLPTVNPPMQTSVSRVDLASGRVSLRGTVERIGHFGCSLTGVHLICPTSDGRLIVTEVAP